MKTYFFHVFMLPFVSTIHSCTFEMKLFCTNLCMFPQVVRVQKCEGARPSKGWLQEKLGAWMAARAARAATIVRCFQHWWCPHISRSSPGAWSRAGRGPGRPGQDIKDSNFFHFFYYFYFILHLISETFSDSHIANASESRPKKLEQRLPSRAQKMRDDLGLQTIASGDKHLIIAQRWKLQVFADDQSLYWHFAVSGSWPW